MAAENRLWGAERIRGELLKLGIRVAKRTIQKYVREGKETRPSDQRWSTFLANQATDIWACDFVQTYDIWFRPIFAFFIVNLGTREVAHVAVTRSPTSAWTAQQLRNATPFGVGPRFIIRDRDDKFGAAFDRVAEAIGTRVIKTAIRTPDTFTLTRGRRRVRVKLTASMLSTTAPRSFGPPLTGWASCRGQASESSASSEQGCSSACCPSGRFSLLTRCTPSTRTGGFFPRRFAPSWKRCVPRMRRIQARVRRSNSRVCLGPGVCLGPSSSPWRPFMPYQNVAVSGMLLAVVALSCGPEREATRSTNGEGVATEREETIGPDPVNNAATKDVTQATVGDWSSNESETSSAKSGTFEIIAYNTEDPSKVTFNQAGDSYTACQGAIGVGVAVSNNSGASWTQVKPPLPTGIAMTWADPAVAIFGFGANTTMFLSAVAVRQDDYDAVPNKVGGCIKVDSPGSIADKTKLTTFWMRAPLGGTFQTVGMWNQGTNVDGGTLAAVGSAMYSANTIITESGGIKTLSIAVASMGATGGVTPLQNPGITGVRPHPMVLPGWFSGEVGPMLVVPTSGNKIVFTTYRPSTGTWTPPTTIASDFTTSDVTLKDGTKISGRGFDATRVDGIGAPSLMVFYQVKSGSLVHLQGVTCCLTCNPQTCTAPSTMRTSLTANAFMPVVRQTSKSDAMGNPTFRTYISYWSDYNLNDGTVRMRFEQPSSSSVPVTLPQKPCPRPNGYWGDYDGMYIRGRGTNLWASLVRSFVDSTASSCTKKIYTASPEHISTVVYNPP